MLKLRFAPATNACASQTFCNTRADEELYNSTSINALRLVVEVTDVVTVTVAVRATEGALGVLPVVNPPDDSEAEASPPLMPTAAMRNADTSAPTTPIRARAPVMRFIYSSFRHEIEIIVTELTHYRGCRMSPREHAMALFRRMGDATEARSLDHHQVLTNAPRCRSVVRRSACQQGVSGEVNVSIVGAEPESACKVRSMRTFTSVL